MNLDDCIGCWRSKWDANILRYMSTFRRKALYLKRVWDLVYISSLALVRQETISTCFGDIVNDGTAVTSESLAGKTATEKGGMPSNESKTGIGPDDSDAIILLMGDVDFYIYRENIP